MKLGIDTKLVVRIQKEPNFTKRLAILDRSTKIAFPATFAKDIFDAIDRGDFQPAPEEVPRFSTRDQYTAFNIQEKKVKKENGDGTETTG